MNLRIETFAGDLYLTPFLSFSLKPGEEGIAILGNSRTGLRIPVSDIHWIRATEEGLERRRDFLVNPPSPLPVPPLPTSPPVEEEPIPYSFPEKERLLLKGKGFLREVPIEVTRELVSVPENFRAELLRDYLREEIFRNYLRTKEDLETTLVGLGEVLGELSATLKEEADKLLDSREEILEGPSVDFKRALSEVIEGISTEELERVGELIEGENPGGEEDVTRADLVIILERLRSGNVARAIEDLFWEALEGLEIESEAREASLYFLEGLEREFSRLLKVEDRDYGNSEEEEGRAY